MPTVAAAAGAIVTLLLPLTSNSVSLFLSAAIAAFAPSFAPRVQTSTAMPAIQCVCS
jgi:hypothetical protein